MLKTLSAELRDLWRLWSIKLAALAGVLIAWLTSDPTVLPQLVAYVPDRWRPLAALVSGFLGFAIPAYVRWKKQPAKPEPGQ